jgi:hypothetical protein
MYAESNRRVGHSEQQRMRERDQAFRNTQQDVQRLKRNVSHISITQENLGLENCMKNELSLKWVSIRG